MKCLNVMYGESAVAIRDRERRNINNILCCNLVSKASTI